MLLLLLHVYAAGDTVVVRCEFAESTSGDEVVDALAAAAATKNDDSDAEGS